MYSLQLLIFFLEFCQGRNPLSHSCFVLAHFEALVGICAAHLVAIFKAPVPQPWLVQNTCAFERWPAAGGAAVDSTRAACEERAQTRGLCGDTTDVGHGTEEASRTGHAKGL